MNNDFPVPVKNPKEMTSEEYQLYLDMDDDLSDLFIAALKKKEMESANAARLNYKPSKDSIVSGLQLAANRCQHGAATPAQIKYLADLLYQRGHVADYVGCGLSNTQAQLSSVAAGNYINDLKPA